MVYKKYLAMIIVLGLMSFEPAVAIQIGSGNELYYDINSSNVFENLKETKTTSNPANKIDGNDLHGQNNRFLNMSSVKIKSFKKFSKKTPQHLLFHKIKHSLIIKKTALIANENVHQNKSESSKKTISKLNQQVSSDETNNDSFQSKANINQTENSTIIENKKELIDLGLNNQSMNNNSDELSNFTNKTNETPEINNTTNRTLNSTETPESNNTTNRTLNSTENDTNLNNTTVSSPGEESTKDKVCDTLLAVGYLSATIAAGCALNPEPAASKIIGVIAVGVAVVSFVAYICIKWFW
ncbi:MAG: hypothetical protein CVV28_10780 [Methanobacteriales archaeon HGW-Methanobacteriales-1]|jgi:hypothetical protein|nr:MAG: hypothetical protein CVV28_10780 [Methanobacteriales archaeon HGW-Methanobacteriales-1]